VADRGRVGSGCLRRLCRASPPIRSGRSCCSAFLWSLVFHLLNGIRHLAWDVGYGFKVRTAKLTAALVYVGSLLLAAVAFMLGLMVRGGLGT
jgi:succinate dehydrogenase / fumarate reductase cytochrome b subunit